MTVTLGVDPHKASHTVVATDQVGRQLTQATTRGTRTSDHQELIGWARQRWPERTWAVEDCRHVAGRLLADLLAAGEQVVLVPPRLMAKARQASRVPGKSDPIDALAVARAALQEPNLPQAHLDGPARELKLLVGHREDLVAERTRIQNRLRWHLHDLDPERAAKLPSRHLEQRRVLDELEAWLADLPDSVQVGIVRELVGRCRELTLRANQLQAELHHRVTTVCPRLLRLPGCGALTAAKILAEVAGVGRFRSEAALAMHAGAAPLECSSGAWQRHRLSRGNRQLNAALHRIAVTQLQVHPPAQAYLTRLQRRASPSARRCGSSSGAWSAWSSTCCTPISTKPNSTSLPPPCRLTNRQLDRGMVGRLAVSRQPSLDARRTRWHWRWRVAR